MQPGRINSKNIFVQGVFLVGKKTLNSSLHFSSLQSIFKSSTWPRLSMRPNTAEQAVKITGNGACENKV
jgi:hypothetical protein